MLKERGLAEKSETVEPLARPKAKRAPKQAPWVVTCYGCAREQYVDLQPWQRIVRVGPCGVCGGRRYVERAETYPDTTASVHMVAPVEE